MSVFLIFLAQLSTTVSRTISILGKTIPGTTIAFTGPSSASVDLRTEFSSSLSIFPDLADGPDIPYSFPQSISEDIDLQAPFFENENRIAGTEKKYERPIFLPTLIWRLHQSLERALMALITISIVTLEEEATKIP